MTPGPECKSNDLMTIVDGGAEQLIGGVIIKIALFDLADVTVQWLHV